MMSRKVKIISFIFVLSSLILTFALASCSQQPVIEKNANYSYTKKFENIYDVIKNAEYVVIGEIKEAEEYNEHGSKFSLQIEKILKGNIDSTQIDVYESTRLLETGKSYMLFLNEFNSPVYPDTVYTSIVKECILEIDGDKFLDNNFVDKDYKNDFKKLLTDIEKSKEIKAQTGSKKEKVVNTFKNTEELYLNSDIIIHAKIKELEEVNKFVVRTKVDILENLKGNLDSERYLYLPSNVQASGEYLLFLKDGKNQYNLSSRNISIISTKDIEIFKKTLDKVKSFN